MHITENTGFEGLREDAGLGLKLAGAICSKHGLSYDCKIVTMRSQLVFSSADGHIIKVFAPGDTDFHKAETVFLKNLHGRLPLPTPKLTAHGSWGNLPYIIMEEIQGIPLDNAWSGLAPNQRRRVIEQLGEGIRALHAMPVGLFDAAPFRWASFIGHQQRALLDNHPCEAQHRRQLPHERRCCGSADEQLRVEASGPGRYLLLGG